jgi:ERCC4-type nuclease
MQQQFATQIVVDDRERSSGVAEALWRRPGVSIAVRRLKTGDY